MKVRLFFFLLRPIYYLLYHQFAWTYDLVAAIVSLGHWQDWVQAVLPFLDGHVLEIGFGPGHLQQSLDMKKLLAFGLDESRQMVRHASRRLQKQGITSRLSVGYAQIIPFSDGVFDSVVATFPSEYIFDPRTLKEINRVLVSDGKLVILPLAWITGRRHLERLAAWLFRISGEAPGKPGLTLTVNGKYLTQLGFKVSSKIVEMQGSQVLIIVAEKKTGS